VPAIHPASGTADFDGDGRTEIVGMASTKSQYDTVRIYERNESSGYEEVFASDADYFAWDVGDTDRDGLLEILGNYRDITFLYESPSAGSCPTEKIWEIEGIWGGRIADMDLDGKREIVSRHLDSGDIIIYENRGSNSYLKAARLRNPTEGDNYLAATFAISDFDGDGRTEVAIGDRDGDLFIYENTADDRYSHTWTGGVPHSRIEYVTAGDFDGDGLDEFVVGARADESAALAKQRWIYMIFDCSGQDEYEAVWSQEIMGVKSESGISAGDVDNDGRDEIVIMVTPSFYIFKYGGTGILAGASSSTPNTACDGVYEAIWHHCASNTQWPIIEDLDADGYDDILINDQDRLMIFRWDPGADSPIRRPWWLSATPLSESEVELCWNGPSQACSYKIYRGTNEEHLDLVASLDLPASAGDAGISPALSTIQGEEGNWEVIRGVARYADFGYFCDAGLRTGVTYWYSVSSVNTVGEESGLSHKASAAPNPPPRLLSAVYQPPFTVHLSFTDPMGPSAQNEARYIITSEAGFKESPSSAMLDSQGKRVTLTMDDLPQGVYTVTVVGCRDATDVPISADGDSAIFHVLAPDISDWPDLSHMLIYPNPVMPNSHHPGRVTFGNLPSDTSIRIYSYNGQLVRSLDEAEQGTSKKLWYLDNNQHQDIASGIYIYVVECANDKKMGKLAVVR
jgi:hypothetical protein